MADNNSIEVSVFTPEAEFPGWSTMEMVSALDFQRFYADLNL